MRLKLSGKMQCQRPSRLQGNPGRQLPRNLCRAICITTTTHLQHHLRSAAAHSDPANSLASKRINVRRLTLRSIPPSSMPQYCRLLHSNPDCKLLHSKSAPSPNKRRHAYSIQARSGRLGRHLHQVQVLLKFSRLTQDLLHPRTSRTKIPLQRLEPCRT